MTSVAIPGSLPPNLTRMTVWQWSPTVVLFSAAVLAGLDRQPLSLAAAMVGDEFKPSNDMLARRAAQPVLCRRKNNEPGYCLE